VFCGFQISVKNYAAWLVRAAAETVEKIVLLELAVIDACLDHAVSVTGSEPV
jgi:hypothetical protein